MEKKQALDEVLQSSKIAEVLEKHKFITTIQHDTDLNGATIGQAMLLLRGIPNLTTELTDEVFVATNAVAIKLGTLRYHQQKYETKPSLMSSSLSDFSSHFGNFEAWVAGSAK